MRTITRLAVGVTAAVLLGACGGESMPTGAGGAAQAPMPLDEEQWWVTADGTGGPPPGWGEAATAAAEPDDLATQWEAYGAPGSPQDLADDEVAILLGFGESGSCPEEVTEVAVDRDGGDVLVRRGLEGGSAQACTDDWNPRTIVLAVDGAALPDGAFRLGVDGGQRILWDGVAPHRADDPPIDHPHRGLGYGQRQPLARLEAIPARAEQGEQVEVVITAEQGDEVVITAEQGDEAVGITVAPNLPDGMDVEDVEPMSGVGQSARVETWDGYRWTPATDAEPGGQEGHAAVERLELGSLAPGESGTAALIDTGGLEPGWYRVGLEVYGREAGGAAEVWAHLEVTTTS